jgi:NTP pyrophosphatase (non-canonical NTP hydrolase)
MLADFKKQREERIACQQERRQEVQNLLGEFKAERAEVAQGLLAAQQNT